MTVREDLELDVSEALRSLERFDEVFAELAANLESRLNDAVASVSLQPIVTEGQEAAESAGGALQDSLAGAVDSFDAEPVAINLTDAAETGTAALSDDLSTAVDEFTAEPIATGITEAGAEGGDALSGALVDSIDAFDASPITGDIEGAVDAAESVVEVEAETGDIAGEIESAIGSVDASVTVEADTSEAVAAVTEIEEAITSADTAAVELSGTVGDVGSGAGGAAPAVAALADETDRYGKIAETATITAGFFTAQGQRMGGAITGVVSKLGPAGIAIAGTASALGSLGLGASEAADTGARMDAVFGDLREEIETIDIGGLNEDLSQLAIRAGTSDDGLRQTALGLALFAERAGVSTASAAKTAEQVIALSLALAGANPELGDAATLADRLPAALARGGRAVAALGLDISKEEIQARAMNDTHKKSVDELTQYDLAAAGAALATEQLGNSLGTKVQQGADSAQGRLRSLRTEVGELFEALGEPLAEPVIEFLEIATSALGSLFSLLEESGAIDVFAVAVEILGGALTGLVDILNLGEVALAGFTARFPGGKKPMEEMEEATRRIKEETGQLPGTLLLAKLGLIDVADGANTAGGAMGQTADEFASAGVTIEDTLEAAQKEFDDFAQTTESTFPGISDALKEFSSDTDISFGEFKKGLATTKADSEDFMVDLQTIIKAGGVQLAAELAALGPETAARAADQIAAQTPAQIQALEAQAVALHEVNVRLAIESARVQAEARAAAILADAGIPTEAALQALRDQSNASLQAISEMTPTEAKAYIEGLAQGITQNSPLSAEAARQAAIDAGNAAKEAGTGEFGGAGTSAIDEWTLSITEGKPQSDQESGAVGRSAGESAERSGVPAWRSAGQIASDTFLDAVRGTIQPAASAGGEVGSSAGRGAQGTGPPAFRSAGDVARDAFLGAVRAGIGPAGAAGREVGSAAGRETGAGGRSAVAGAGPEIVRLFIAGLAGGPIGAAFSVGSSIGARLLGGVKRALGIASPSREGQLVVDNLVASIRDRSRERLGEVRAVGDAMGEALVPTVGTPDLRALQLAQFPPLPPLSAVSASGGSTREAATSTQPSFIVQGNLVLQVQGVLDPSDPTAVDRLFGQIEDKLIERQEAHK